MEKYRSYKNLWNFETSLPATQKQLFLLVSLSLKRPSVLHRYIKTEGQDIFQKSWSCRKILCARKVICIKSHTESPHTFDATTKTSVAMTTLRPGSVHPWIKRLWFSPLGKLQISLSNTQSFTTSSTKSVTILLKHFYIIVFSIRSTNGSKPGFYSIFYLLWKSSLCLIN
jgi:hypothetical protein